MSDDADLQSLAEKMMRLGWATETMIRSGKVDIRFTPAGLEKLRALRLALADFDTVPLTYAELTLLRALARGNAER